LLKFHTGDILNPFEGHKGVKKRVFARIGLKNWCRPKVALLKKFRLKKTLKSGFGQFFDKTIFGPVTGGQSVSKFARNQFLAKMTLKYCFHERVSMTQKNALVETNKS
jgi:hypothetical protein